MGEPQTPESRSTSTHKTAPQPELQHPPYVTTSPTATTTPAAKPSVKESAEKPKIPAEPKTEQTPSIQEIWLRISRFLEARKREHFVKHRPWFQHRLHRQRQSYCLTPKYPCIRLLRRQPLIKLPNPNIYHHRPPRNSSLLVQPFPRQHLHLQSPRNQPPQYMFPKAPEATPQIPEV